MSSLSAVLPHLEQRFESQRLVFWHDMEGEYAAEIDSLVLDGVTILRVENNEYAIKNRVLRDEPHDKFLIYRGTPVAPGTGNWLLDLELAYGVFTADWVALVCQELDLIGTGIDEVVREYEDYFRDTERVQRLKALLATDDDVDRLRAKMCATLLDQ